MENAHMCLSHDVGVKRYFAPWCLRIVSHFVLSQSWKHSKSALSGCFFIFYGSQSHAQICKHICACPFDPGIIFISLNCGIPAENRNIGQRCFSQMTEEIFRNRFQRSCALILIRVITGLVILRQVMKNILYLKTGFWNIGLEIRLKKKMYVTSAGN